jgi:sortase A
VYVLGARSVRHKFGTVFLLVGAVLLCFAIGAYGWMSVKQRQLASQWKSENTSAARAVPTSSGEGPVTLLLIPKINLQAAILEGTNTSSLLLAPGHVEQTAWPGQPGNAVIAGHRDTFFRDLQELSPGDNIYVRRSGRKYLYVVTKSMIVAPNELSVTQPTRDTRLTLITCFPAYYIGPAPQRLIVVAELQAPETPSLSVGTP